MPITHHKLHGLNAAPILAAVETVLLAHGVEGVELLWRTEQGDWVLELTVERPESRVPGEGISIDLCTDISRALSAALDEPDLIPQAYRLEVGSPGLDRALYVRSDYERFAGQTVRLKLRQALNGQYVIRGTLQGVDAGDLVQVETEHGLIGSKLEDIDSARLVFDWKTNTGARAGSAKKTAPRNPADRGLDARRSPKSR